jgi:hypothetical protein
MTFASQHVRKAFEVIRKNGIAPNGISRKWDVIDPATQERFPPKAVLRIAKELANDTSFTGGGGWPTNDPLRALGFEIVIKREFEESDEATDIEDVIASGLDETTKQRLINARLGQGGFRAALLEIWNEQCAITGCDIGLVLRASHVKAWRHSDNRERLDPDNGILLAASIDALFDKHMITFTIKGRVRAASCVPATALAKLGVPTRATIQLGEQTQTYMTHHRAQFERVSEGKSYDV